MAKAYVGERRGAGAAFLSLAFVTVMGLAAVVLVAITAVALFWVRTAHAAEFELFAPDVRTSQTMVGLFSETSQVAVHQVDSFAAVSQDGQRVMEFMGGLGGAIETGAEDQAYNVHGMLGVELLGGLVGVGAGGNIWPDPHGIGVGLMLRAYQFGQAGGTPGPAASRTDPALERWAMHAGP